MNKLSKITLSLLTVAALAACSETIDLCEFTEETYPTEDIYISPYGDSAYADFGLFEDWELTDIPDWLTVSPTSGNAYKLTHVTFSASTKKYQYSGKGAIIILKNRFTDKKITDLFVYNSCPVFLFKFDNNGETKVIENWYCQYDWEITACPSWLTVSPNKGKANEKYTLTLRANSNVSANPRQDFLTFTYGDYRRSYYVNQCTDDIEITPNRTIGEWTNFDQYTTKSQSDVLKVAINSTADWTTETTKQWINLSQKSGKAGKTEITVTTNKLYDTDLDFSVGSIKFKIGDIVLNRILIVRTY